ncbi:type VII secretion integral membrane protein EccD [Krasilnikovia sp. MM14-A1259]|uniref:type VII secretion integral membrane protein EccD n=1 Tax=Krasilnikovia sp. MM14-A1259 TaxID=3373539 RepID=UPI00382DE64C
MTAGYTRVTVVGASRRVDMVLPSAEPVGQLLPDALAVAGEPVTHPARLRHLVTLDGRVLAGDDTLQGHGVTDGTVLRLAAAEDLPPAPVVHDVTEETAEDLDRRATRWTGVTRRWTATAGVVAAAAAAGLQMHERLPTERAAAGMAAAGVLAGVIGAAFARSRRPLGAALVAAAGTFLPVAVWTWGDSLGWPTGWRLLAAAGAVAVAVLLFGVNAVRGRAAMLGGLALLGLVGLWAGLAAAGLTGARTGAVVAVVVVAVVGLLPRWALSWSGLAMLDDRRVQDRPVNRRDVHDALAAAHGSLTIVVAGCAASAAAAGWLLASESSGWATMTALLLAVVLVVRCRTYPLAAEVIALLAGASVVVGTLWWRWSASMPAAVGLAAVVVSLAVPVTVLVVDPPEHVRARLRRIGDILESAAVIALLPMVLGVFGVYARLLGIF